MTLFILGTTQLFAQHSIKVKKKEKLNVEKYTVMEQYEPELVLSVGERVRLKKERIANLKRIKGILDTLDISNRRKKRMIKALFTKPSSNKFDRAVAELQLDEREPED